MADKMNHEVAKAAFEEFDTDKDGFITLQGKFASVNC